MPKILLLYIITPTITIKSTTNNNNKDTITEPPIHNKSKIIKDNSDNKNNNNKNVTAVPTIESNSDNNNHDNHNHKTVIVTVNITTKKTPIQNITNFIKVDPPKIPTV